MPGPGVFSAVLSMPRPRPSRSQIASDSRRWAQAHALQLGSHLTILTCSGLTELAEQGHGDAWRHSATPGSPPEISGLSTKVRRRQAGPAAGSDDFLARERSDRRNVWRLRRLVFAHYRVGDEGDGGDLEAFHDRCAEQCRLGHLRRPDRRERHGAGNTSATRPSGRSACVRSVSGPAAAKTYLVNRPGSGPSTILAGGCRCAARILNFKTLYVANRIPRWQLLKRSRRLNSNLSEEKSYTYNAYSRVTSDLFPGVFVRNCDSEQCD